MRKKCVKWGIFLNSPYITIHVFLQNEEHMPIDYISKNLKFALASSVALAYAEVHATRVLNEEIR